MKRIEIIPVEYGRSCLSESMIFQNGAEDQTRPIVFKIFLLKVNEKRILVDAGCVTMPGFEMTDFIGPIEALKKYNVSPFEITDVVITHAHHDHIECVSAFKNADVFIQKDEYEIGKNYIDKSMKVRLFEDEAVVGHGIKAVKVGGHSVGSCVVEIEADQKHVIVGDECYKRECIDRKIPTGASYSQKKSREFIRKYGSGEYKILMCHDADDL